MNRSCTLVLVLGCVLAGAAWGIADDSSPKPASHKPSQADSAQKPRLRDAVRVSTNDAAVAAAQKKAQKDASEKSESSGDAVLEFHPAASNATAPSDAAVTDDGRKTALKNLHGEVYGAAGAGGHVEGGKAGTTSKSKKSSVYVETNRATTNPSH